MLLILSPPNDAHVRRVIEILKNRGIAYRCFSPYQFPVASYYSFLIGPGGSESESLILRTPEGPIDLNEISVVWYRRHENTRASEALSPVMRQFAQAEAAHLLECLPALTSHAFWLKDPLVYRRANQKPLQLKTAKALGLRIPDTYIGNDPEVILQHFEGLQGPLAVKPINTQSRIIGLSPLQQIIQAFFKKCNRLLGNQAPAEQLDYFNVLNFKTVQQTIANLRENQHSLADYPAIIQTYVPKQFELRITVVGDQVFPCAIHSQEGDAANQIDWRHDVEALEHSVYELPEAVSEQCREFVKRMGLVFGCIDMIVTPDGEYVFLECNPDGQWLWIEERTGMPIGEALVDLFISKSAETYA